MALSEPMYSMLGTREFHDPWYWQSRRKRLQTELVLCWTQCSACVVMEASLHTQSWKYLESAQEQTATVQGNLFFYYHQISFWRVWKWLWHEKRKEEPYPQCKPSHKGSMKEGAPGDFTRATARISAVLLLMGCGCPTLFKLHSLVTEKKEGSRKDSISVTHFRTCPVTTIIIHDFGGGWIQVPFVLVLAGSHSSYCQKSTLHLQV